VACVLVAHSGLRTGVLGSYRGGDGLRVGDFPELSVVDGAVEFEVVPTMLVVRRELSKAGHQYFSFLGEEGCGYLASYLEERVRLGEDVGPGSAVVTPKTGGGELISTVNIGDAIRGAIRGAGFGWRPYVLRSYFDTQLMLAESRGYVLRDYRKFWMGHTGDIENRYTTNKCRLPEDVVRDMRTSYARGLEFLETEPGRGVGSVRDQFRRELLLVAGFDEREIDERGLDGLGDEEFQSIVKQRLLGDMVNNGATQKTVDVGEVEEYLASGWEFVASLPNGRAIVKLPK